MEYKATTEIKIHLALQIKLLNTFLKSELSCWKTERPWKKSFNYFDKTMPSISFDILKALQNIQSRIYFSDTHDSLSLNNSFVWLQSLYSTLKDWVTFRKMPPISTAAFYIPISLKYSNPIPWRNNRWCVNNSVFCVVTLP